MKSRVPKLLRWSATVVASGLLLNRCTNCSIPYTESGKGNLVFKTIEAVVTTATTCGADIVFYGKVVDQHGDPVEDAIVDLSFSGLVNSSKMRTNPNQDGLFAVKGNGESLYVYVKKEGYHHILATNTAKGISEGGFDYGHDWGHGIHKPSKENPILFTLFKPDELENLFRVEQHGFGLPQNGELSGFAIFPSKESAKRKDIELRLFVDYKKYMSSITGKYDWRLEITAPGGKLAARENDLDFIAPENNYEGTKIVEMKETMGDNDWKKSQDRKYWVKFDDGIYARFNIEVNSSGSAYITEGYSNFKPGSRNLESPPKVWGF